MKRLILFQCLFLLFTCLALQQLAAQTLVITNVHVIDRAGGVIERGSVVVENGRIASVSEGVRKLAGARDIDAKGMTRHARIH